jgi:hypothetical protein
VFWWQRALAATPADVQMLIGLAEAQLRAGDRQGARITIDRGLEREPHNPTLALLSRR